MSCSIGKQMIFYVAKDGNDSWSGKLASPDSRKSDGPFATLTRARQAVRQMKESCENQVLSTPVTVMVRGGKYYLEEPFVLTKADSGTHECPITWCAYENERPVFSGGRVISGWKPYKDNMLQADFPGTPRDHWPVRQLFMDGQRLPRSRWPKVNPSDPLFSGWAAIEGPVDPQSRTAFTYLPGAFRHSWKKPTMGEITYFMFDEWGTITVPIRSIDEKSRTITLIHAGHAYEWPWYIDCSCFYPTHRFCMENMLEDVEQPGEWCYDTEEKLFYLLPPKDGLNDTEIVVPILERLWDLDGVSWINIRGFTFTETVEGDEMHPLDQRGLSPQKYHGLRYGGESVRLRNAQYCHIENNLIDAVGSTGIYLYSNSERNIISRNEIRLTGTTGISLVGTELKYPRYNDVSDNYIHDCCIFNKGSAGIFLGLSDGNRINNNKLEFLPHCAINLGDNAEGRNIVEYNEIRHVCRETWDNGAINTWMESAPLDAKRCGHIIRYNLITDSYGRMIEKEEGSVCACNGIYLDNFSSNCHVYGNIVIRAPYGGVVIHAGQDNVIENNIFIDCASNLRVNISINNWEYWLEFNKFPAGNHFTRNIGYQTQKDPYLGVISFEQWVKDIATIKRMIGRCDNNLYFQDNGKDYLIDHIKIAELNTFDDWKKLAYDENSIIADPLFVNKTEGDYRLREDSPAFALGFEPIDISKIGIRKHS